MWPPSEPSKVEVVLFLFGTCFFYSLYTRWRRNRTAPQPASTPSLQSISSIQPRESAEAQRMREHYLQYCRLRERHIARYRRLREQRLAPHRPPDTPFDPTEVEINQSYIDEFAARINSQLVPSITGIGRKLSGSSNSEQAAAKTPPQQSLPSAPQSSSEKPGCPQPASINNENEWTDRLVNQRHRQETGPLNAERQAAKKPVQQSSPSSSSTTSMKPESPRPASTQPVPASPSSPATTRTQPPAAQAQQTNHHGERNEPHSSTTSTTSPKLSWIENFEQTLVRLSDSTRLISETGRTKGLNSTLRVEIPSTIEELQESYKYHICWAVQAREHDRLKYRQWRRDAMMACFLEWVNEINVTREGEGQEGTISRENASS